MTARIERPLSPHLQTYRVTLTMALSIIHRATGIALYFGTLLLAWWLIAAASGPGAYANVQAFTGSIIGKLIVFGKSRTECLMRLRRALSEYVIEGVETTIPLFQRLVTEPDIIDGHYDIHWLEKYLIDNT